jgi:hypothetical protein
MTAWLRSQCQMVKRVQRLMRLMGIDPTPVSATQQISFCSHAQMGTGLMLEENKGFIYRLTEEIWNRRALDAANELFAPKAIVFKSGVALPGVGPAVIKGARIPPV